MPDKIRHDGIDPDELWDVDRIMTQYTASFVKGLMSCIEANTQLRRESYSGRIHCMRMVLWLSSLFLKRWIEMFADRFGAADEDTQNEQSFRMKKAFSFRR